MNERAKKQPNKTQTKLKHKQTDMEYEVADKFRRKWCLCPIHQSMKETSQRTNKQPTQKWQLWWKSCQRYKIRLTICDRDTKYHWLQCYPANWLQFKKLKRSFRILEQIMLSLLLLDQSHTLGLCSQWEHNVCCTKTQLIHSLVDMMTCMRSSSFK